MQILLLTDMLIETLITIILGSWLFVLGQRIGRIVLRNDVNTKDIFKGKIHLLIAFLFGYLGLLLLAFLVPELPTLPVEWRFYSLRVTWTIIRLLLLFIGGIAFTISRYTSLIQVVGVILICSLGLGSFTGIESYFISPIYASLQDNLQPNGVFRQSSASSCAPSALATVLRIWGINATESSVARLAETSRLGTSMGQLLIAIRSFGMDGIELETTWEQMQLINRPGVLGVWFRDGDNVIPHAVALLGFNGNKAIIGEPTIGIINEIDRQQFEKDWRKQYLPIFRPQDISITASQAVSYLQKLGDKIQGEAELNSAINRFQKNVGLQVTGKLDPQTVLLLSGSFLEGVPTLKGKS
ncbi:MAG: cysteine peptidase family C39 domain-containing protein [Phormidium sp.]